MLDLTQTYVHSENVLVGLIKVFTTESTEKCGNEKLSVEILSEDYLSASSVYIAVGAGELGGRLEILYCMEQGASPYSHLSMHAVTVLLKIATKIPHKIKGSVGYIWKQTLIDHVHWY